MWGLRSKSPDLVPFDSEIEHTLHSLRKVSVGTSLPSSSSSPLSSRQLFQSTTPKKNPPEMENQPNPPPARAPLLDHFTPGPYTSPSCIQHPEIVANHFEIKSNVIQMLTHFYGLNNEDPYRHLDDFLYVCLMVKIQISPMWCSNCTSSHSL